MRKFSPDKQLKKSIKRIEKELQALGLNAEILRELLSGSSVEDEEAVESKTSVNGDTQSNTIRKSGSGRSLGKTASIPLSPKKQQQRRRRQARARAEYELAGELVYVQRSWQFC